MTKNIRLVGSIKGGDSGLEQKRPTLYDEGLYGIITIDAVEKVKAGQNPFKSNSQEGFHLSTRTAYNFTSGAFQSDYETKQDAKKAMVDIVNGLIPPDVEENTKTTDDVVGIPVSSNGIPTFDKSAPNKEEFTVKASEMADEYQLLTNDDIRTSNESQTKLGYIVDRKKGTYIPYVGVEGSDDFNSTEWHFETFNISFGLGSGGVKTESGLRIYTIINDKRYYLYAPSGVKESWKIAATADDWKQQISTSEATLTKLKSERDSINKELESIGKKPFNWLYNAKKTQLTKQLNELSAQITREENILKNAKTNLANIEANEAKAAAEAERQKRQKEEDEAKAAAEVEELKRKAAEATELKRQYEEAKAKADEAEALRVKAVADAEELKRKADDEQKQQLEALKQEYEKQKQQADNEASNLKHQYETLKQQYEELKRNCQSSTNEAEVNPFSLNIVEKIGSQLELRQLTESDISTYCSSDAGKQLVGFFWNQSSRTNKTNQSFFESQRFPGYVLSPSAFNENDPQKCSTSGYVKLVSLKVFDKFTNETERQNHINMLAWEIKAITYDGSDSKDKLITLADVDKKYLNERSEHVNRRLPYNVDSITVGFTTCAIIAYSTDDSKWNKEQGTAVEGAVPDGYLVIINPTQSQQTFEKTTKNNYWKAAFGDRQSIPYILGFAYWSINPDEFNDTSFRVYKSGLAESFTVNIKDAVANWFTNNFINLVIIIMFVAIGWMIYKVIEEAHKPPSEVQLSMVSAFNNASLRY